MRNLLIFIAAIAGLSMAAKINYAQLKRDVEANVTGIMDTVVEMIQRRPRDTQLWLILSSGAEKEAGYQGGIQAMELCLKAVTNPKDALPCLNHMCGLKVSVNGMKERPDAMDLSACETALNTAPQDPEALMHWGEILVLFHRYVEASFFLGKSIEIDDTNPQAMHNYCLALSRAGLCDRARKCGEKLAKMRPKDPGAWGLWALLNSICNGTHPDGVWPKVIGLSLKGKQSSGLGCKEFTTVFNYTNYAKSIQVVHEGGEWYGSERAKFIPENAMELDKGYHPPNCTFQARQIRIVEMEDVYMIGKSGILFKPAPECVLFTGDHRISAHIEEDFDFRNINPSTPFHVVEEPSASIVQLTAGNYYHTFVESITRGQVLKNYLKTDGKIKLFYPPSATDMVPKALNVTDLGEHFELTRYNSQDLYFFKKLYVVEWIYPEKKASEETNSWGMFFTPKFGVELTRSAVSRAKKPVLPEDDDWKVVFAERGATIYRDLRPSEDGLIAALRHMIGEKHFVSIQGWFTPVEEQLELYSRAAMIVGPHGAAFANMLWMYPNTSAVLFPMRPTSDICFAHLAAALGIDYYETPFFHSYYYGHYMVDDFAIQHVLHVVQTVLERHGFSVENPVTAPEYPASTVLPEEKLEAELMYLYRNVKNIGKPFEEPSECVGENCNVQDS